MRGLVIIAVAMCTMGCMVGDTGVNPPPTRAAAPVASAVAPPSEAEPAPEAPAETAPESPPSVFDPPTGAGSPRTRFRRPTPKEDRDPARLRRIGDQRVVTLRLRDLLPEARLDSPHFESPTFQIMKPGRRSYRNPWRAESSRGMDQRLVWSDGKRFEWALRSAVAIPAPSTLTVELDVPPASVLSFSIAAGARTPVHGRVLMAIDIEEGEGAAPKRVWSQSVASRPIHRLKHWSPQEVDLSPWAGRRISLSVHCHAESQGSGYRYTAFLAEPVILTSVTDEQTREVSRRATGLDVADNVILIVVDAQRADSVGRARERARLPRLLPHLENLAEQGAQATAAYSVGNQTRLSTFAFLQSQYPTYGHFHKVRWNYTTAQKRTYYSADPPLLARILGGLGYRTVGVANNLFLFGNLELSLDGGFHEFFDHRHNIKDTALITETAIEWLRDHADERFFMMINYNAPHLPYSPPDQVMGLIEPLLRNLPEGFSERYLGEVVWTDQNIGTLLAALEDHDLARRTLVVVTSDHGEIMDPSHECWSRNWRSHCLHQHGKTLFEEELRVPLVARLPGRIPSGSVLESPISHLDLAPTILGILGVVPPADQLGRDLSSAFLGGSEPPERVPMVAEARLSTALVWDGHKYIIHDNRERMSFTSPTLFDRRQSLEELYDLSADPRELRNLAWDPESRQLLAMREKLASIRQDLANRRGAPAADPPPVKAMETPAGAVAHEPEDPRAEVVARGTTPSIRSTLLFHAPAGGTRFSGRIVTTDRFVNVEVEGAAHRSEQTAPGTITVDVEPGDPPPTVRFRTATENAPIEFQLLADGLPLGADRFYVGAWGLKLYNNPIRIDGPADYRLAWAPRTGPAFGPEVKPGVFYWRDGQSRESAGTLPAEVEAEESIDAEVRSLMKDWGYTGN